MVGGPPQVHRDYAWAYQLEVIKEAVHLGVAAYCRRVGNAGEGWRTWPVCVTRTWSYDEDRTYHGIQDDDEVNIDEPSRIFVELSEYGPTERERPVVFRELHPTNPDLQFGWGYNGTGTSVAADAILRDALGQTPPEQLREDFCEDVLAHLEDRFRLRCGAVLRWVRGWAAQHRIERLPAAVATLPPVSSLAYEFRPPHLSR